MIPWEWVLLGGAVVSALMVGGRLAWQGVQSRAHRRATQRAMQEGARLGGKLLRHAPSGRLGWAVGFGHKRRWRGALWPSMVAELVTCPCCWAKIARGDLGALIYAKSSGGTLIVPIAELASPLPSEAAQMKAALDLESEGLQ